MNRRRALGNLIALVVAAGFDPAQGSLAGFAGKAPLQFR